MKVRTAVIPAAGLGTRFLPVTKSVPKELLPILDKPMLQYVVEEAAEAGIERVIVVTSRGKESIAAYFQAQPDLEERLAESGATALAGKVRAVAELAQVSFVIQEQPLGLGHAVLTAEEAVAGEPFVVILPDDIISHSPGVVDATLVNDRVHQIQGLVEKPTRQEAPSNLTIVGRYILPPEIFDHLRRTPPGTNGEIQLTDALLLLLTHHELYAYEFLGTRYDGGTPLGLLRASLEFGLAREDTRQEVLALLKTLQPE